MSIFENIFNKKQKNTVNQIKNEKKQQQPQKQKNVPPHSATTHNNQSQSRVPARTPPSSLSTKNRPSAGQNLPNKPQQAVVSGNQRQPAARETGYTPRRNPNELQNKQQQARKNSRSLPTGAPKALPPASKQQKNVPKGPLLTATEAKQLLMIIVVSLLLAFTLLSLIYGVFWTVNNLHFDWNYDITVTMDDSSGKITKYTTNKNTVLRNGEDEPYICISKLAEKLDLSSVGDGSSIKFYKANDLNSFVTFENGSNKIIINGEIVSMSAPAYIRSGMAYVPISFFDYYTSGVSIDYDSESRVMSVVFSVNEELSTPKRKVLDEFCLLVRAPESIEELTSQDWYECMAKG